MLHSAKTLKGYALDSLDGNIGKAKQFLFDDRYWTVGHLEAETGNCFNGEGVLISPYALASVN